MLTFPFSWRRRLAQDAGLLGRLTRIVVETALTFYAARAAQEGGLGAKTGAVTVVQRTSSDLRLNPHLHLVVLDAAWHEDGGELAWEGLGHLRTSEVGEVLERLVRRIEKHLRRCGLLGIDEDEAEPGGEGDPEANLAASAVSGQTPPAGPQWVSRLAPLEPHALAYDKPPRGKRTRPEQDQPHDIEPRSPPNEVYPLPFSLRYRASPAGGIAATMRQSWSRFSNAGALA